MTIKVLYVDDEPDIREIATMSLQVDPDVEVLAFADGPTALASLGQGGSPPDVILLDVMMPGMDGPAVLAEVRRLPGFEAVPVVFITARAQEQDRDRLMQLGAAGVITKPFDPMTLAAQLRSFADIAP